MPGNKEALKKLYTMQNAIEYNEIKQHVEAQMAGGADSRVGIADLRATRCSSRWK